MCRKTNEGIRLNCRSCLTEKKSFLRPKYTISKWILYQKISLKPHTRICISHHCIFGPKTAKKKTCIINIFSVSGFYIRKYLSNRTREYALVIIKYVYYDHLKKLDAPDFSGAYPHSICCKMK